MNSAEDDLRGTISRRIVIERIRQDVTDGAVKTVTTTDSIDGDGVTEMVVTEVIRADCGCVITDVAQIGGICSCGKVLCQNHFYHCERCGKGLCAEEKREWQGHIYCRSCRTKLVILKILGF